ncbi:FAD-dependent monooxygenase [Streptomyces montanisoli]|uniref:FAD-dependent monooxygenase n=1 Tax=Streptomyces montanisoli TaxID=2798581 RepID=A0A940MCR5_9ACTN|nr:FAD-dependent monooxygenase [Streptomyces montanisoli]MBP0460590.1 FAD-dependent monooxygenase [Streptomyces montanisoli]
MENTDILISGAGVAGPALAYWLNAAGFSVTVVERAPALRTGGQTVDLRGAGREVVARMGLMDRARSLVVEQRGYAIVDARGRMSAAMPADSFGGEGIISEIEILRGDLGRLLYDASEPGRATGYLFDDTITGLDEDADGVTVTFEKAAARRFALVVGADGAHSTLRRLAFGPEERYFSPLNLYTSWFGAVDQSVALDGWYLAHNAPGGRVASARPGHGPGELKVSLSFRSGPLPVRRGDTATQRALLKERFAGLGWEVPRLLRALDATDEFTLDHIGQVRMDAWTRGRAALIGDAGYCPTPLTGLGTSLSLIGAYVLAGELASARGDHRAAFAAYERTMRPYVRQAQELPPGGVGGYAPNSRAGIALRNLSMRSMNRWPVRPLLAKQFAKAGDIALPDYPALGASPRRRVNPVQSS